MLGCSFVGSSSIAPLPVSFAKNLFLGGLKNISVASCIFESVWGEGFGVGKA